jgi:hypothetical protein
VIASKTTLRLMLSYLEVDEHGIDSVYRILKDMDREEAISVIWTLLGWLFPAVDGSRAAWEQWLQDGIVGQSTAGAFDTIPDLGGDEQ